MATPTEILNNLLSFNLMNSDPSDPAVQELTARYGRDRQLTPTEEENLRREAMFRMAPDPLGEAIANPYARQPIQAPPATTQQPQQQFVGGGEFGGYDYATRHAPVEDPSAYAIQEFFRQQEQMPRGRAQRLSPQEYATEMRYLAFQENEWERLQKGIRENYQNLDAPAKAQFDELTKRERALRMHAGGRVRNRLEYLRAINEIYKQARLYRWDYHTLQPGSQPGDKVEKEGIVFTVDGDGVPQPQAYTADYIKQNTFQLPNGLWHIPTLPGKNPEYIKPTDMKEEIEDDSSAVRDMRKRISDRYKSLMEFESPNPGPEKIRQLSKRAADIEMQIDRQARAAVIGSDPRRRDLQEELAAEGYGIDIDFEGAGRDDLAAEQAEMEGILQEDAAEKVSVIQQQRQIEQLQQIQKQEADRQEEVNREARLQRAAATANTDDERIQIRVENWEDDPHISLRAEHAIPIVNGAAEDFDKMPDDSVIITEIGMKYKKNGKWFNMPDPIRPIRSTVHDPRPERREAYLRAQEAMNR